MISVYIPINDIQTHTNLSYTFRIKEKNDSVFFQDIILNSQYMKFLILVVITALLAQVTIAWDVRDSDYWWWKKKSTSGKHHKHHKHHRHHHHRTETCVPNPITTTSLVGAEPSAIPVNIDPFYPYNIGGKLNQPGASCSNTLTSRVVSLIVFTNVNNMTDFAFSLPDSLESFLGTLLLLKRKISLARLQLEVIFLDMLILSTHVMVKTVLTLPTVSKDMA